MYEGEYQAQQFRGNDRVELVIFPTLNLMANQIFASGE
jgi:Uma2 family endonuclease